MRTGAAAATTGCFHETALYDSDDGLLAVAVPFVEGGLAAGEPTIVTLTDGNAALVRDALGGDRGVTFVPAADQYTRPATAIRTYRELFASLVAEGAHQIRVVGDVPHPGAGGRWEEWVRYEAAVNVAFDAFPVWGLCPYDTRLVGDDVLADVLATHPHIATGDGHRANAAYADPVEVVRRRPPAPLPDGEPTTSLHDPTPADARRAAMAAAVHAGLDDERIDDLLLVASELVTNAIVHGARPVTVDVWARADAVVLAVGDAGPGPGDPFAGLLDPGDAIGGRGLWMAHQVCAEITHHPTGNGDGSGFTVSALIANRT